MDTTLISPMRSSFARILSWLSSGEGTLRERTARSGIWLVFGDAANRLASILKLSILGRLLSPNDFGLVGITNLVLQCFGYFTQTGFDAALIQKRGDIRPYLNTVWSVQLLRGVGIGAAVLFIAPGAALFFATPGVVPLMRATALIAIVYGFTNPAVVYLRKELKLRNEVIWRFSSVLAGLGIGIPLAFILRNAWALFASLLAGRIAETVASYLVWPYHPRFRIHWGRARELTHFGRWIFAANIVAFLELYIDSLIIGRLIGPTALGLYQMAAQLSVVPMGQLAGHLHSVMFPAFSKIQRSDELRHAFIRSFRIVCAATLPVGCFFSAFSDIVVRVVLGARWLPICSSLKVLAWAGVAKGVAGLMGPLLLGCGKPHLSFRGSLLSILVLAVLLYPLLTTFGILGVAVAVAIASFASTLYQMILVYRFLRLRLLEVGGAVCTGILMSVPFLVSHAALVSWKHASTLAQASLAVLAILAYILILVQVLRSQLWSSATGLPDASSRSNISR